MSNLYDARVRLRVLVRGPFFRMWMDYQLMGNISLMCLVK
jgi:hypothetical protein